MNASLVWQKLDKKFTGNQYFKHRVLILGPKSERYKKFIELRTWCWNVFGDTYERDILLYMVMAGNEPTFIRKWTWHFITEGRQEISLYFATDLETSMFNLKWG